MTDFIIFLFLLWVAFMAVGLIISLMPIILAVCGFFLAIGFFALLGSIFTHMFT